MFFLRLGSVHQRSGGGPEAVERRPVDRFAEEGFPGSPNVSGFACSVEPAKTCIAADTQLSRTDQNLTVSISAKRLPKPKRPTRRGRRALRQTL